MGRIDNVDQCSNALLWHGFGIHISPYKETEANKTHRKLFIANKLDCKHLDLFPSDDVLNHFHPVRVIIVGVIRKSSPMTIGSGTPPPPPVGYFEETAGSAKYFNNLYGRSGEYQKERIFPLL